MIYVTNSIIYDFVEELQIAERRVTSGAGAPNVRAGSRLPCDQDP